MKTLPVNEIVCGDALAVLRTWPAESVHCVVTSPPYWGLRDYGVAGQLGLEADLRAYVRRMVAIFRQVRRVLRNDGTLWLNLGDCYTASGRGGDTGSSTLQGATDSQDESKRAKAGQRIGHRSSFRRDRAPRMDVPHKAAPALRQKNLCGIPWRVAFALQAAGWILRADIIWHKSNPMPESIKDRPTKAHEYLFLLAKSERYYYDNDAVKEPVSPNTHARISQDLERQIGSARAHAGGKTNGMMKAVVSPKALQAIRGIKNNASFENACCLRVATRNKRSVWKVSTLGYPGAHFATFPPKLIEPCIMAGAPAGGVVLDPFMGAGTTALVASRLGRAFVGIELKQEYIDLARDRLGLFGLAVQPETRNQKPGTVCHGVD